MDLVVGVGVEPVVDPAARQHPSGIDRRTAIDDHRGRRIRQCGHAATGGQHRTPADDQRAAVILVHRQQAAGEGLAFRIGGLGIGGDGGRVTGQHAGEGQAAPRRDRDDHAVVGAARIVGQLHFLVGNDRLGRGEVGGKLLLGAVGIGVLGGAAGAGLGTGERRLIDRELQLALPHVPLGGIHGEP